MYKDYIPTTDARFNEWQANLITIVSAAAKQTAWSIPADKVAALQPLRANWENAYAKTANKNTRTPVDVKTKNDARHQYEQELRIFVQSYLAKNKSVTDADREQLGITVPAAHRRHAAPIAHIPEMKRIESDAMQHTLRWEDKATKSKGHPEGVDYCEIWRHIADANAPAPINPKQYEYVDSETKHSCTLSYDADDIGKAAHYILRWGNKEFKGPWSLPVFQIINR